jgi:hypothetical protein
MNMMLKEVRKEKFMQRFIYMRAKNIDDKTISLLQATLLARMATSKISVHANDILIECSANINECTIKIGDDIHNACFITEPNEILDDGRVYVIRGDSETLEIAREVLQECENTSILVEELVERSKAEWFLDSEDDWEKEKKIYSIIKNIMIFLCVGGLFFYIGVFKNLWQKYDPLNNLKEKIVKVEGQVQGEYTMPEVLISDDEITSFLAVDRIGEVYSKEEIESLATLLLRRILIEDFQLDHSEIDGVVCQIEVPEHFESKTTKGHTKGNGRIVCINMDYVPNLNSEEFLTIIGHEVHHVYVIHMIQKLFTEKVFEDPSVAYSEIEQFLWYAYELKHYKTGYDDYEAYKKQEIEYEARAFAAELVARYSNGIRH